MNKKLKSNLILCSITAFTLIFSTSIPLERTDAAANKIHSTMKQAASQPLLIFKRTQPNSNSIKIGDQLLNNQLYVNSIWPAYTPKNKLTWKENPYHDKTWTFYFHSLDMVGYLMNAYEKSPKQAYLQKAKWYIESWMAANPSPTNQASPSAWDDHSTANRVVNMIYFWQFYKDSTIYDKEFESKLTKMLTLHGDFLADNKHYTAGNNHGIFQDRSLIQVALLFPDMENSKYWYNKAMNRLLVHVNHDVTPSGIHKEHSPSYHIVVLNLFKDINSFITQFGIKEPILSEKIKKMEDYMAHLITPNRVLPMLGDSNPSRYIIHPNKVTSDKLKFVVSKGKQGVKPANDTFYPDGEMAIFRKMWDVDTPFYLLFTAAYHSNAHKHADDLSFLLSYGKTDYFVDSGKYNYNETNGYRKYFRSTMAHNTVTVDEKSYPLTKEQVNKSRMDHYKTASDYSYVTGSHNLYKGVKVQRTIIYLKNTDSVLIRDTMVSDQKHTYRETFNIGKDVQVKSTNKKTFILKSTLENKQIEFKHLTKDTKFTQYQGSTKPIAGWQSLSFNQKHPITQLQFTTNRTEKREYKFVMNTDLKNGIQNYTVKSQPSYDLYTIVYKNGKRGNIRVSK